MKAATEPMITMSVRVPERMRDQFDALAKATDRNRQFHAFEALRRYVEAEAWQVDLIAERLRQLDAGEIGYAGPERVAAVRAKRYSNEEAG
ncbi:MAG: CopG family ribbon-helix-helix protein [Chloroflexota bacterium]